MKKRNILLDGLIAGLLGLSAWAGQSVAADLAPATPAPLSLIKAQSIVRAASHGNATAIKTFPGPAGMTGVVFKGNAGNQDIAWIAGRGEAVVVSGTLIGPNGEDLTRSAMYQQGLMVAPDATLRQAAQSGRSFVVGTKGPVLTVFFDLNCYYCHVLHQGLDAPINQGKLRVRYVPVSIVKDSGFGKAVKVLAARMPEALLKIDEDKFNLQDEEGGLSSDTSAVPAAARKAAEESVRANTTLMAKAGGTGTPTLLYCPKGQSAAAINVGMPSVPIDQFIATLDTGPNPACGK